MRESASLAALTFELQYHWRRPTFWVIAIVFGAIGFADIAAKAGEGNAFFFINSPSQIFQTTIWYTIFGILAAAAFVAETFVRDAHYRMEGLILATPIRKWDYLGTRFLAAFGVTLLAFSAYLPGMILGTLLPGLNPFALGPLRLDAYGLSYGLFVLPNLWLVAAIAFGLAARTRSLALTYAGAIVLVMFYLASLLMVGVDVISFDQYRLWALFDPFGFYAFEEQTLTWTVHQHNTLMPPLGGTLLANRLLWIAIGLGIWLWSYWGYSMQLEQRTSLFKRSSRPAGARQSSKNVGSPPLSTPPISPVFREAQAHGAMNWLVLLKQWAYRSRFEIGQILQGRAFQLLTLFGLLSLIMAAIGTRSFNYSNPSTDILIHSAHIYLDYILFAIIVVYAAELVWRDRTLRFQAVIDATPVSNGVLLLSKLTALFAIITFNLLLAMGVMVGYQILNGYTYFQWPLYLQMLFLEHGPYFYLTAVLALFTQVLTRHKYVGMALVLIISLSKIPLDAWGLYHNLYRFAATNDIEYSPMNGYGHLFTGHLWYTLYWSLLAAVLMVVAYIIWPRGSLSINGLKHWRFAWQQTQRSIKLLLAGLGVGCLTVGGWIIYNTTMLNAYQPPGKEKTAAEIERRFQAYADLPMPVVTETTLAIDLYPEQRYFVAEGSYLLENRTQDPIRELHLLTFIHLDLEAVQYPGATLREAHPEWGYYIYDLAQPLLPGDRQELQFTTRIEQPRGFQNHVDSDDVYMIYPNEVVGNGTNLYSPFILPFVGYTKMVEQKKAWLRHQYDLPPLTERMRPHTDPTGRSQGLMLTHLGWGSTDITIGTSFRQTAVTSGRLVDQWQTGDRQYVRYQSTLPDRGKFTIYSGEYEIYRNDEYRVPIEIYYHPPHAENVALIAEQVGEALTFYEQTFGPYPFEQVRVVEFVYYDGMVFSDGGVLGIPEVLVWKSKATGPGEESVIDWVTYLLAQAWWDNQLIAADVAGGMTIREALSAYASELYQRSRRSPEAQRQAKQQQMQAFFRQLGKIDFQEPPLADVYNELPIARHKGGMVLELIENQIGQEALLAGIREFFETYRYQPAPYATVLDLQAAIAAQAPPAAQATIAELFAEVVTYQVGLTDAAFEVIAEGEYRVQLEVAAQKLYTTALGQQQATALDVPLTIALRNQAGEVIHQETHQFIDQQATVELLVNEQPVYAAVDADYTLPSAVLYDNVKRLRPLP